VLAGAGFPTAGRQQTAALLLGVVADRLRDPTAGATLVGIAIAEGLIGGVDDPIVQHLPAGAFDQGLRAGEHVRLALDGQGFIRRGESAEACAPAEASAGAPPSAAPDRLTLRLRAPEIAAGAVGQFAQCREQVKTADIFPLADTMLAWLL
jgi:hypothetical protein